MHIFNLSNAGERLKSSIGQIFSSHFFFLKYDLTSEWDTRCTIKYTKYICAHVKCSVVLNYFTMQIRTLASFSGTNSFCCGASGSASPCCRDLLCCSRFSWAWAACWRSSSAFRRALRRLLRSFFISEGARFSVTKRSSTIINKKFFQYFIFTHHLEDGRLGCDRGGKILTASLVTPKQPLHNCHLLMCC